MFVFPNAPCLQTVAAIHPDSQGVSDRFRASGNPQVIICICFFIAIIRAPLLGPSTSLSDRAHVLSGSRGRLVAGGGGTVGSTDKTGMLVTMHHRDGDIWASLYALEMQKRGRISNNLRWKTTVGINYRAGEPRQFIKGFKKLYYVSLNADKQPPLRARERGTGENCGEQKEPRGTLDQAERCPDLQITRGASAAVSAAVH